MSKFCITVAPVVVRPDIDSKKASAKGRAVEPKKKGSAPIKVRIIQDINVNKKAESTSTSLFFFLKINETFNPVNKQTIEITKNTTQSVPLLK